MRKKSAGSHSINRCEHAMIVQESMHGAGDDELTTKLPYPGRARRRSDEKSNVH